MAVKRGKRRTKPTIENIVEKLTQAVSVSRGQPSPLDAVAVRLATATKTNLKGVGYGG